MIVATNLILKTNTRKAVLHKYNQLVLLVISNSGPTAADVKNANEFPARLKLYLKRKQTFLSHKATGSGLRVGGASDY